MNIYMTTGTYDFLKTRKEQYPNENMLFMQSAQHALLLHETPGKTVFAAPRSYEVIVGKGAFQDQGFVAMNNIPVTNEGRPLLEYQFKNQTDLIEKEPGFIAIRVLRPKKSNIYVLVTAWEKESAFTNWTKSPSFQQAHTPKKLSSASIFSGAPYITKYNVISEKNNTWEDLHYD